MRRTKTPYVETVPVESAECKVTEDDVARLRSQRLTDPEIFDVALAAAARCFFSKSLDSMGAQPDPEYEETAQLLDLVPLRNLPA
jgi:hypothetical protein